ncbi:MAG: hypothetical protein JOZ62_08285 [Acidobacteriaceae bacterium]|nr:hypothetical protein [Acidobacteriaceae bacterium]
MTGYSAMRQQMLAIASAQIRSIRNHLPKAATGSIFIALAALVWYGAFAFLGVALAIWIPLVPLSNIQAWLGAALFGVFLFWQTVPLFTLTGGWSVQLDKLQIYPVSTAALFTMEVLLRLTTGVEMLFLLLGACVGLSRHLGLPWGVPLLLLLYIPFNLFVSLAVRELLLHSFERNRFRELFAIFVISIGILPQVVIRSGLGMKLRPHFMAISNASLTPWHAEAMLSSTTFSFPAFAVLAVWIAIAYTFARVQFAKAARSEELLRPDSPVSARPKESRILGLLSRLLPDPIAVIVEKELRSLIRMPRFRVIFAMACFFSVLIFVPMGLERGGFRFVQRNFLPLVNLYGLLLLGDALLWNMFGFDRSATQTYFITPVELRAVVKAKNIAAAIFMMVQSTAVFVVALGMRLPVTNLNIATAFGACAVAGVFFLAVGNLTSVMIPRPINPTQTLRKQAGGQVQVWLFACMLGMSILIGFAYVARWALASDLALFGVLAIEFAIGVVFYRVSLDSAVQRGMRDRERILDNLSRGSSPVAV